jgi:hypothetical protein
LLLDKSWGQRHPENHCRDRPRDGRVHRTDPQILPPQRYQIYEIDRDWSEWLAKTYPVEDSHADGKSLARTKSHSVDLIHAYGVFVYLPLMISIRYFREIARVAAPGAFVVFNIISERCLDERTTEAWLNSSLNYPCFLSTAYVSRLFEDNRFRLVEAQMHRNKIQIQALARQQ